MRISATLLETNEVINENREDVKLENNAIQDVENSKVVEEKQGEWSLEIPKINLKAEIAEGTDEENLNKYIGHFEETSTDKRKYRPCRP